MQRRGPNDGQPLRERIERVRRLAGGHPTAPASGRRRRISRREREARRQRMIYWGLGIAAGIAVLVLAVAAVNDYVIKPRTVLASVDGTEIRRRDYWKYRSISLIEQANQYQQIAGFVQGEQQTQYLQLASQARQQLDDTWGSTDVDDATLQQMIDGQVFLKNVDQLDLEITDQSIDDYIDQQFAPAGAQILTPSPTPTLIPERAEWATATAVSATAAAIASAPVPTTQPLPAPPSSVPSTDNQAVGTPAPLAASSAAATPAVASPVPSPTAVATPSVEEARATAEASFDTFSDSALDEAHMSRDDYIEWVVRPRLAQQLVTDRLGSEVGQSIEQVRAAHILVGTQDLANEVYQRVTASGEDFATVARETSTDTSTAPNGGDLGWFTRAEVVEPFANAAFALQPNQISEPFQSEFGWHIVKVFERADDRAMTDEQIQRVRDKRVQTWLEERRAESDIDADIDPTPTPFAQPFQPPVQAPPPPTPTPVPVPSAPAAAATPESP